MRSTKQRSRSKSNRPKTLGNIVNRVFDSSGPESKVRGTPQQIIEKYQVLARDAQLSNDRVAAENFQQHAEHYTRLLAQAQREAQAEAEARRLQQEDRNRQQQDRQQQDRQQQDRHADRNDRNDRNAERGGARQGEQHAGGERHHDIRQPKRDERAGADNHGGFDLASSAEEDAASSLVETPEARRIGTTSAQERDAEQTPATSEPPAAPPRNRRKASTRRSPDQAQSAREGIAPEQQGAPDEGKPAPKRRLAPRKPRAPKAEDALQDKSSAVE